MRNAILPWSGLKSFGGGEVARRLQRRDTMAGNSEMRPVALEVSLVKAHGLSLVGIWEAQQTRYMGGPDLGTPRNLLLASWRDDKAIWWQDQARPAEPTKCTLGRVFMACQLRKLRAGQYFGLEKLAGCTTVIISMRHSQSGCKRRKKSVLNNCIMACMHDAVGS